MSERLKESKVEGIEGSIYSKPVTTIPHKLCLCFMMFIDVGVQMV